MNFERGWAARIFASARVSLLANATYRWPLPRLTAPHLLLATARTQWQFGPLNAHSWVAAFLARLAVGAAQALPQLVEPTAIAPQPASAAAGAASPSDPTTASAVTNFRVRKYIKPP